MARLTKLTASAPPSLPIAPLTYSQQHHELYSSVLRLFFNQLITYVIGLNNNIIAVNTPNAGITADRPTAALHVGETYFDTTLGVPIWWNGTAWVNASGTTV